MFPILLFVTLLFWTSVLLQNSLSALFLPDFVLVLIFVWSLYVLSKGDNVRVDLGSFVLPFVIGIGLASFSFYSVFFIVPYLAFLASNIYLIFVKKKWAFRPKESFLFHLFSFLIFVLFYVVIKKLIIGYDISSAFWIKTFSTYSVCILFWGVFMIRKGGGKIR